MANRRLQYRQVFWRNGWSTASERAQASSDWTAPRRPWHNNGDRLGLSELGAVTRARLYPRALTPRLSPLHATRPQCNLASPEVVPYSLRSGTRADDDPSSRRSRTQRPSRSQVAAHPCGTARSATALRKRPLLPETWVVRNIGELAVMPASEGIRSVPPVAPALQSGAEDSRAAERQRPSRRGPRARERRLQARLAQQPPPTVPTVAACARRAFRGTRIVARRNALSGSSSSTTPSGPARPFRLARGTPAGHDQHRRRARNPPGRPDQNLLRFVFCFFRTRSEATRLQK